MGLSLPAISLMQTSDVYIVVGCLTQRPVSTALKARAIYLNVYFPR